MEGADNFRSPNGNERVVWQKYREWCLRHGRPDPGPTPEEWPTAPRQSAHALHILASSILAGEEDPERLASEIVTRSGLDEVRLPPACVAASAGIHATVLGVPLRVGPRMVAVYGTPGLGIYANEGRFVYGLLPPGDESARLLSLWPTDRPARQVCLLVDRRASDCWWVDRQAAMEFLWTQPQMRC